MEHDLIIGADSGADHLRTLGVLPNLVVGDFDSVSKATLTWLEKNKIPMKKFPAEKDKTDCEIGIDEAIDSGATQITLTATWGGRFDQTLSHVFLLRATHKRAVSCYIKEEAGDIYLVERFISLKGAPEDGVSLLALEECTGLRLEGFKYQVPGEHLGVGSTLGISNILLAEQGTIELETGSVIVVHQKRLL